VNLEGNIASIRARHAHVEQNHIGMKLARSVKGVRGAILNSHLKHTGLFQAKPEQPAGRHIIVHD
jgi:hypothetical protein